MSFAQSFDESRSIQGRIQEMKTDGNQDGASSPVRDGSSTPGTAHAAPVSEMVPRRTKIKVRTSSLTRNWASN